MSKIGFIVCGNSGIDYMEHKYDIEVFRSILLVGGKEYTDFLDINANDFYNMLIEDENLTPTTAQTATGVMLETMEKMRDKGYEELLVVTISSQLSGTYAGAVMASNMIKGVKVTVFDSKSLAYAEARMILRAAELAETGKTMEEIIVELEFIRDNHNLLVSCDTLRYLVKGGRISGASGFVGGLLKIKPLLMLTKEGKIESSEKIRTSAKSTQRLIERYLDEIKDIDIEPYIVHANADDRVKFISEKILEERPDLKEIKSYPLTPVVGAHAGPGAISIGFILNK